MNGRSYPPVLFEPIHYRWTVVDGQGEAHEAEGEVLFEPRGTWRHGGEAPLRFSVANANLNLAATRQAVQAAYALMAERTRLSPAFTWAVMPRGYAFCAESRDEAGAVVLVTLADNGDAYPCSQADAEQVFHENGFRLLYQQIPGLLPFQNALIADMFGVFYGEFWRGREVPAWFRAGLAQLYYVTSNPLALRLVQDASRADSLFLGGDLNAVPADPALRTAWEHQAYTMVLYLADVYGAEVPFALAESVPEEGFAAAFTALAGDDLDGFLVAWERWLFSADAGRAVAWTLYTPPTPTLPPTRTHTPIPPTATATATPTATPTLTRTPTATPRVVQIVSPLPTFTPFTPLSPTPSSTPRPPGSLDQPSSGGGSPGGGICPAALAVALLPAVALVAVHRRKRLA